MTVKRMEDLNREALADHEKGQYEAAKAKLEEAIKAGEGAQLDRHPLLARTHLHLGIVYTEGLKNREEGVAQMATAVRIQPDIKITKSLSSASVRRAFIDAREQARRPATATPAPAPAPTASPEPPRTIAEKPGRGRKPTEAGKAKSKGNTAGTSAAPATTPSAPPAAATPAAPSAPPVAATPAAAPVLEPPLPSSLPTPVYCPEPLVTPGADVPIRCGIRPALRANSVILFYRAPGGEAFTEVPLERSKRGWFTGNIPAAAIPGVSLQWYVEARAAGGKAVGNNGDGSSPNLLLLRAPTAGAVSDTDEPTSLEEENPLEAIEKEQRESTIHRRSFGAYWAGLSLGSGYGWHPTRTLEFRTEKEAAAGTSSGGLLHLGPELGYQWSERLGFSVQLRYQIIPEEGSGDLTKGHPAKSAFAVLARAHYYLGDGNLQGFGTANLGAGQGFRLVIPPNPVVKRNDTIDGGPVVVGAGAGGLYHFNKNFAWTLEVRGLIGVPHIAAVAELNTGAQLSF